MLYRPFGKTGKDISVISFGGMRFSDPQNLQKSADTLLYAHSQGINYFDTAPIYCGDQSEDIFGHALQQLPRDSFYVSSKSGHSKGDDLRKSLEHSLKRLKVEKIDFFYIWHLMSPEDWEKRKHEGAVEAALQAQNEGLIGDLLCSSHMEGDGLAKVLDEKIFAGVLLGYNAINFPYRRIAVEQAGKQGIGVVTMNPLGGGLIPQNPERFDFLKTETANDVVSAALQFNLSHPAITSALVGFANHQEIDQAVAAADSFVAYSLEQQQQLEQNIKTSFAGFCTGCGYCLPCPVGIPIPKYLDSYNQLILTGGDQQAVLNRYRMHWNITPQQAKECIRCGDCEARCTQHLPIIQRLEELPLQAPG
ncbi:MAG: aldo/keto reductase [Desulfuromusa sp.]|jgi:predicted aldo/keto reductase-like oxidoreductase|nr:aldo/keto reductase [Desulfuromusa sp.]